MAYSNQRITKIKRDVILELLQRAEAMDVEDACVVTPAVQTLTPYPDADQTRTWIRDYLLKGISGIIPIDTFYWHSSSNDYAITRPAQTYISTVLIDGLPLYVYNHKIIDNPNSDAKFDYQLVTKPGLMLSNLLCPVSYDAGQGSYIRQANSTNAEITGQGTTESYDCKDFRSLYHGHYGYTFLNRGIIHRESGSTHDNNDSYMLHYSPLPNSSTSYEGMLIPGTLFQNSYTNIQTICYPTNPSMQGYSDTTEKTLQFTAINNNTDNSNNTTLYNGRFVGEGWSFEFNVSGNHAGSGSNWGEDPTTGPNSSNGICIDGEIVYTDINGLECTQLIVDWCEQTLDAEYNPNNPNATGSNSQIAGGIQRRRLKDVICSMQNFANPCIYAGTFNATDCNGSTIYSYDYSSGSSPYAYQTTNTSIAAENIRDYNTDRTVNLSDVDSISYQIDRGATTPTCYLYNRTGFGTINCRLLTSNFSRYYSVTSDNFSYSSSTGLDPYLVFFSKEGRTGSCSRSITLRNFYAVTKSTSTTNVNIYLNITDQAKLFEDMGISWNYTCDEMPRFMYELSTTACTESYCTSVLLYENVSITPDGDFAEDIPDKVVIG